MGWSAACPVNCLPVPCPPVPCLAVQLLLPAMLLWLPAAVLPLLVARAWLRHPRRVPWAAIDLVSQAARRLGLGPGGVSLPLVLLRAAMLAAVAMAAARPFLPGSPQPAGQAVRIVDGAAARRIELVAGDAMPVPAAALPGAAAAPAVADDGTDALLLAISALARSGRLVDDGTAGPPTVEVVSMRDAGRPLAGGGSAVGRVVILGDGVLPRPAEADRLAALVRAGAAVVVVVGPETTGSPDRERFSAWLESLAGIAVAGTIDCDGCRIALEPALVQAEEDWVEPAPTGGEATLPGPRVERCAEVIVAQAPATAGTRAATLARTNPGGIPLVVESRVGPGRLCVWALPMTLPRPDGEFWSDVAAWPVFLPLVDRLLTRLLAAAPDGAGTTQPPAPAFPFRGMRLAPVLLAVAILLGLLDPLVSWALGGRSSTAGSPPANAGGFPATATGIALARAGIIGTLIAMAALWRERPTAPTPAEEARPRSVALIVDVSPSMATADVAPAPEATPSRQRLAAVLEQLTAVEGGTPAPLQRLCRDRPTSVYAVGAEVTPLGIATPATAATLIGGLEPAAPAARASRQGDAVERAIDAEGDGLAAVVIASDGAIEAGASWTHAAGMAARRGVPIIAIPVGGAGDPHAGPAAAAGDDVTFTTVKMPRLAWRGERVSIGLRAERSLRGTAPVAVTLAGRDGRVLAQGMLQPEAEDEGLPPASSQRLSGDVVWTPATTGTQTMLVRATGEAADGTNTEGVAVEARVVDEPIRVLLVDAAPRFEQRFLEQTLRRDPRFAVEACLLETTAADGMRTTAPLPDSAADWSRFDVVVLGDLSPGVGGFPEAAAAGLREAASREGVGIAWTPGHRWCRAAAEQGTADGWLPAALTQPPSSRSAHRLRVVRAGLDDGWFPATTAATAEAAFTAEVFACIAPVRLRPTARVLAVAEAAGRGGDAGEGAIPAIVLDQCGAAPILGHLCETWRWRARAGTPAYEAYWRNAILRLARAHAIARLTEAVIEVRPMRPVEGERARIDVVATRQPTDRGDWRLEHVAPDGGGPAPVLGMPAVGEGVRIGPLAAGWHTIRLTTPRGGFSREFPVAAAPIERPGRRAGTAAMEAAAVSSGGCVLPLERIAVLADTIDGLERGRADRSPATGSRPPETGHAAHLHLSTSMLVIGLLACCAIEWSLRGRSGLP